MAVDLELAPKRKRPAGEPCCEPLVYPDVERDGAERLAAVAKALGDPIRLQLVDVLRKHGGEVCVCELTPLFDVGQPTVSHHLKVLREAGLVELGAARPLGLLLRPARRHGRAQRLARATRRKGAVMLRIRMPRRRARSAVAFDERTGAVCDARCRAATRRERDLLDSLAKHGPR